MACCVVKNPGRSFVTNNDFNTQEYKDVEIGNLFIKMCAKIPLNYKVYLS